MTTELQFLDDTELFESTGTVVSIEQPVGVPQPVLVLDRTIFYPQGGGQPTDVGTIKSDQASFIVTKVYFDNGSVFHTGQLQTGVFRVGDNAKLVIDEGRRMRHAKLHTGGHLVMTAVDRLFKLPSVKGYHFPDGPYVEFAGVIDADSREQALRDIQVELDELVSEDSGVTAEFVSIDELRERGVYIPAEIPAGKPTRVVTTSGYQSPCGGTHVKRLGQLTGLRVKGIKSKSGNTRVSYYVEGL